MQLAKGFGFGRLQLNVERIHGCSLEAKVFEFFGRTRKNRFASLHHNGPLNQLWMSDHGFDELIVSEIPAGNVFLVRLFFCAQGVSGFESGTEKKFFEGLGSKPMLKIIDGFELYARVGQVL